MPDKVDTFDYDKCGFTRSITFEAKTLLGDIEQATKIMRSKGTSSKLSTTHVSEPYVDLIKEAERLENFVNLGLRGLLQSNDMPTNIFDEAGTEQEGIEYLIEIGLDDEYQIKFVVVADKSKISLPSDKSEKATTMGDYKGATPLTKGLNCLLEKYSTRTIAYFYYHHNMTGKNGAQVLKSGNWTDFVTAFTYPVPLITRKREDKAFTEGETQGFGHISQSKKVGAEEWGGPEGATVFNELAPHLRTKEEAEFENKKLDDPRRRKKLESVLATMEKVGNFRASSYIYDAFTNKAPGLYAKSEYAQEIDFVYKEVINNAGVGTLAAKIAHCLMLNMTLNEILEMLCRKAMDELDYDALKEILLNSPWAAAMQEAVNTMAKSAGHAAAANEALSQEAKKAKNKYSAAQTALDSSRDTYKSYPSPENLKILCQQEINYEDALEEANIKMGAQFFGTAPLADAGLKVAEYKDILVNVISNLPDYVCRDIIGKLAGAIKFIDKLMDTDWEKVFDGMPDELSFKFPRLMVGDLIASIKAALKMALLKTIAKILVELIKKVLEEILDLCLCIRQVVELPIEDVGCGKEELAELIQPDMMAKAMDFFDEKHCGDLSEADMIAAMFDLFEDLSLVLTTAELCALLDGTAYPGTIDVVYNLIEKRYQTLTGCLDKERTEDLFKILGGFIDTDLCIGLVAQEERIRETAGGTYDGACPPKFKAALECGDIDPELCNEQLENMKTDRVNKLAELAKLMDRDPDSPIEMPLPLCGATPPPGAEKINYANLVNPYEFAPMQYMVGEVLGAMFIAPRKAFNSDLSNFMPAVTFFDTESGHGSESGKTGMGPGMHSKVNNLDLEDQGSVNKLEAAAVAELLKGAGKGVAPSLRQSLQNRSNFVWQPSTEFKNLGGFGLPMLDDVPVGNVYKMASVKRYEMPGFNSTESIFNRGIQLYCVYPRVGLAGDKKDPYIIFITDVNGNLLFADAGDGNTSLFTERTMDVSIKGGTLLDDDVILSNIDPFEDPLESVQKILETSKEESAGESVGKLLAYLASGGDDQEMAASLIGLTSPQSTAFSEVMYEGWESNGMTKQTVPNSSSTSEDQEALIADQDAKTHSQMAIAFATEYNLANQYILRKIADRIATSELFSKEEFQEFASALILSVPCADDEPDVKTSLLDIPEALRKINEKMARLACVEGSLEDKDNPPLKKAALEGVVRLAIRLVVIELSLRGIFVFAKFKMGEIFKNNFFLKYIARETMQMVKEMFGYPYSVHFTRVVKDIFDDRKALNDPFINPFGPQEVDEETGIGPEFFKLETVQDAIGFMALEQIKVVSDQLDTLIGEIFSGQEGWGMEPAQQFLNMLRYGAPEEQITPFGNITVNKKPRGANYRPIPVATDFEDIMPKSSEKRFFKRTIQKINVHGPITNDSGLNTDKILATNLEALKQQGVIKESQLTGIDIDNGQMKNPEASVPLFVGQENVKWIDATTELGADVFSGGFILERYIKHDLKWLKFPDKGTQGLYNLKKGLKRQTPLNITEWVNWLMTQTWNRDPTLVDMPYNLATGAKSPWKYGLRLSYVSPFNDVEGGNEFYDGLIGASTQESATKFSDASSKAFRVSEFIEIQEVDMNAFVEAKQSKTLHIPIAAEIAEKLQLDPDEATIPTSYPVDAYDENGNPVYTNVGLGQDTSFYTQTALKAEAKVYIHPLVEVEEEIPFTTGIEKMVSTYWQHEDALFNKMAAHPAYRKLVTQSINVSRFSSMVGLYSVFAFKNNQHMRSLFSNTKASLKTLFVTLMKHDYRSDSTDDKSGDSKADGGGPSFALGGFPVNLLPIIAMTPFQIIRGIAELLDPGYMRYKSAALKAPTGPTEVFEPPEPPPEEHLLGEFGKTMDYVTEMEWYKWDSGSSDKDAYDFDWNIFGPMNGSTAFSFPWTPWGWLLAFVDFRWWDDLEDAFRKKKPCPLPPAPPDPEELEAVYDTEIVITLGQYIDSLDPKMAPMEFGVTPCMSLGPRQGAPDPDSTSIEPNIPFLVATGECPDQGYGPSEWPPRLAKSIGDGWAPEPWEVDQVLAVPSEFKAAAEDKSLTKTSQVEDIGLWPSQTSMVPVMQSVEAVQDLSVCHQLYLLKRYYEAVIEDIDYTDSDGQQFAIGMINRLMEVMDMTGPEDGCFDCTESPDVWLQSRLGGGIGMFYKSLTIDQIIDYFKAKAIDFYKKYILPSGLKNVTDFPEHLAAFGAGSIGKSSIQLQIAAANFAEEWYTPPCTSATLQNDDICNNLFYIYMNMVSMGYASLEGVSFKPGSIDNFELIKEGGEKITYGWDTETTTVHGIGGPKTTTKQVKDYDIDYSELMEFIKANPDQFPDIELLMKWPPEDPIHLFALWKWYNAALKAIIGDNDLHGLMRGRGFAVARSKTRKTIENYTIVNYEGEEETIDVTDSVHVSTILDGTQELLSPDYIEHWPSDGTSRKSALQTFWKEDTHNLGSSGSQAGINNVLRILADRRIEWTEFVFVEEAGDGLSSMEDLMDLPNKSGMDEEKLASGLKYAITGEGMVDWEKGEATREVIFGASAKKTPMETLAEVEAGEADYMYMNTRGQWGSGMMDYGTKNYPTGGDDKIFKHKNRHYWMRTGLYRDDGHGNSSGHISHTGDGLDWYIDGFSNVVTGIDEEWTSKSTRKKWINANNEAYWEGKSDFDLAETGKAYKTTSVTVHTDLLRRLIENLWKVEMMMSHLGYGPYGPMWMGKTSNVMGMSLAEHREAYKTSTPIMCMDEESNFFKKYFENPETGERADKRIATIAGLEALDEKDRNPDTGFRVGIDPSTNWILTNSLYDDGKAADYEKSIDSHNFKQAGEEYDENVFGPDENGYFWILEGDKYNAWPKPDQPGHDPYQPSYLSKLT